MTETAQTTPSSNRGNNRARTILLIVFILLLLLLGVLSYFLVRILVPVGGANSEDTTEGLTWVRSIYGYGKQQDTQLRRPNDTAIDENGVIWVTDPKRARVMAFGPDGRYQTMLHMGPALSNPRAMQSPSGVGIGPNGNIFIADFGRQSILEMTPENELVKETKVPYPLDVAVSENLMVVGSINGLAIMDRQGNLITTVGKRGKGKNDFDFANGVVIGPDETIYVADTYNNRVAAYDRTGKRLWVASTGTPNNSMTDNPSNSSKKNTLALPVSMTMDAAGRLVVADAFNFGVAVVDAKNGKVLAQYGKDGRQDGRFAYPSGISYDPARDWFAVADTTNDRVQIVRIEGSGGGLMAAGRRAMSGLGRICLFPLILLLVAIVLYVVSKRRQPTRKDNGEVSEIKPSEGIV